MPGALADANQHHGGVSIRADARRHRVDYYRYRTHRCHRGGLSEHAGNNRTVNSATSITVTTLLDTISQSQGNDNVPILLFDGATEYVDDNTLPAPIVGAYQYQFALSPSQIRTAYGINSIQFPGGIAGNGSGQTIAIIGLGDDPSLADTGTAGFATSDLGLFDSLNGIPDPPSFQVIGVTGQSRPTGVQGDDGEFSSDVEWAHAIAPGCQDCAHRVRSRKHPKGMTLVALSNRLLQTAKTQGASVVSMSFGFPEVSAESPTIQSNPTLDQALFPAGLTYVTSTGDKGAPGGYPAYSSDALAIGGTQLAINPDGSHQQEAGWDNPASGGRGHPG